MSDLYRDHLLYHAKHSGKRGVLQDAQVIGRKANPSCGDVLTMYMKMQGETITDVQFEGQGCVMSLAAASILSEKLIGRSISEALALTREDVVKFLSVPVGLMRTGCVMLGLEALQRELVVWKKD